jgi:uncharacterized surface protein with fasciclin (FAS1) repeats
MMHRSTLSTLALAGALVIGGCADLSSDTSLVAPDAALERRDHAGPPASANRAPAPGDLSIAELVTEAAQADEPEFTLLLAAIEYIAATNPESDLVAGLFDNEQYTVFAPTDAAFLDLVNAVSGLLDPVILANDGPFAAIDALLGAGTLEAVVTYHVTEGRRAANSVVPRVGSRTIETLLGATFAVSPARQITAVGSSATITGPNLSASNGIVHVIDAVLLPVDLGL